MAINAFRENDSFDFQPQLTTEPTEPTAAAGKDEPQQMFQQIMQQMTQGQGGAPDAFDFTTEPTAPEPGYDLWRVNYGRSSFADGHNDGGIIIEWTPGPDDNVGLPAADGLLLPY